MSGGTSASYGSANTANDYTKLPRFNAEPNAYGLFVSFLYISSVDGPELSLEYLKFIGANIDDYVESVRGELPLIARGGQQQNGGEGWNTANNVVGATSVVPSTIEMGTVLIKQSANYTDDIAKVAKISSRTATGLGVVSMVITTMDGATSQGGWKNHHTADLIIGGAQTFLLGTGPVGWGIGLVWLTADLITTGVTRKSITENLFD